MYIYMYIYIYICMTTSSSLMSGYVSVQLHVKMTDTCQSQYTTHIMQYTIYNIYIYTHNIYIYVYTSTYSNSRQYVRELVNTCARQCFITLSAKKNESTGSHVIKNRAHLTCPGALDLT